MKTQHLIHGALVVLGALSFTQAMAHGVGKPLHGGIVRVANDVNYELVPEPDGATIYLLDHDKPMSSKGITGKLTVLQRSKKAEVAVKEAGDNKLRADGIKLGKGDKVVAVLNHVEGKTSTVRFTIK